MGIIAIDPGHGGSTTIGGSSPNNATGPGGTLEKTLTLEVGLLTRDMLARNGHSVHMTRTTDVNIGLRDRAGIAMAARADAFVSIHFNGNVNTAVQGTETHVYLNTSGAAAAFTLATLVQRQVQGVTGYRDRGIFLSDLAVINPTNHYLSTAACLLEISFLTDPSDETRLSSTNYKRQLAEAIAVAVHDYVTARFALFDYTKMLRDVPNDYDDTNLGVQE